MKLDDSYSRNLLFPKNIIIKISVKKFYRFFNLPSENIPNSYRFCIEGLNYRLRLNQAFDIF
jgi:hypothetical protein